MESLRRCRRKRRTRTEITKIYKKKRERLHSTTVTSPNPIIRPLQLACREKGGQRETSLNPEHKQTSTLKYRVVPVRV